MANVSEYIESNPLIAHGKPVFTGTRILVDLVREMIVSGESNEDILLAYPLLTAQHIAAVAC